MNMGCNLGGFISPALTPVLATYIGWENALHVAAVLALCAAALWLGIHAVDGHIDESKRVKAGI
jgi:dipeptide/tripeptide permease